MKITNNNILKKFGVESENIEFKEAIPTNSEKYLKTVIAFANGNGGKIVFGVEDETLNVIGINNNIIFKLADSVTNAIYDSCEPKIIPNVSIQEVDNKLLIVVDIISGMQKPYYFKSLGLSNGTFIRVSGTTRKAPQYIIQELLLKGSNRSFDQLETDKYVTSKEITRLCDDIYNFIIEKDERKKETIHRLSKNQLISWKIIKEKNRKYLATNSFMLITGNEDYFPESKIQCAVFKGNSRSGLILSKKELKGPLYQQIDEAYNFVIQHIDVVSTIDGLYRNDKYELPPFAIREIIANAVCHRSYLAPGKIQVALYDDRLEVTSPGNLDETLTLERLKSGLSKVRNKAIASVFSYMEIVETWGSGIPRVFEEIRKYDLKEPEIINLDGDVRVNLYRKTVQTNDINSNNNDLNKSAKTTRKTNQSSNKNTYNKNTDKTIQTKITDQSFNRNTSNKNYTETIQANKTNQSLNKNSNNKGIDKTNQTKKTNQSITNTANNNLNEKTRKLLEIIDENNSLTIDRIAEKLSWTVSNVKYYINKLKNLGILKRIGTIHNGHWEIIYIKL